MVRIALGVCLCVMSLTSAQEKKKAELRTDEGELRIVKEEGSNPSTWKWYLATKSDVYLMGMPDDAKTGQLRYDPAALSKLDGEQVVVISRAGYFGLGKQKCLLVLKVEAKKKGDMK